MISISTAEGKWPGNWESEYLFSLRDLQLLDLDDDVRKDTIVSIFLSVEKVIINNISIFFFLYFISVAFTDDPYVSVKFKKLTIKLMNFYKQVFIISNPIAIVFVYYK